MVSEELLEVLDKIFGKRFFKNMYVNSLSFRPLHIKRSQNEKR